MTRHDVCGDAEAQAQALDAFAIDGIRHNIPFLSALMQHPRWRSGHLSTGFIAEEFPDGFHAPEPYGEVAKRIAAVAAAGDDWIVAWTHAGDDISTDRVYVRRYRGATPLDSAQVLVSPEGGWTMLITYPRRPTCIVAVGEAWQILPVAGQPI